MKILNSKIPDRTHFIKTTMKVYYNCCHGVNTSVFIRVLILNYYRYLLLHGSF